MTTLEIRKACLIENFRETFYRLFPSGLESPQTYLPPNTKRSRLSLAIASTSLTLLMMAEAISS